MKSIAVLVWAPLTFAVACGVSEIPRTPKTAPPGPSDTGGSTGNSLPSTTNPPTGTGGMSGASGRTGASNSNGGSGGSRDAAPNDPPREAGTPSAPLSGMTVNIGGTAVPKEKVVVFLHIGHSNMAGRVTTPAELRPFNFETDAHLWAYAKGGMWKPAKEPLSGDSMTSSCGGVGCAGQPSGAGPGMSILRAALAAAPDIYAVSIGRGQSGLTGGVCRNFRKGGLLYDYVMAPALELKGKVTFGGIWAMFGQSEVNDMANISKFGECIAGVVNDMRTDLGEPDLPFLLGDWEEGVKGSLNATSPNGLIIVPQIHAIPMQVKRSLVIPTDGLPLNPLDNQHYDLTGYKLWGERGVALLEKNGWAPWAP